MYGDYDTMRDFQLREEQGEDYEPRALTFTGSELDEMHPGGMDETDVEVVGLAMDRNMSERIAYLQDQLSIHRSLTLEGRLY